MVDDQKDFDEKEEYKKLFKIRDDMIMNMQTAVQPSGVGFFTSNLSFGNTVKPKLPLENSKGFSSDFISKHKALPSPRGEGKDDRTRLERMLRARIEKRRAYAKFLTDQGPCKKPIEPKPPSYSAHNHRKNTWSLTASTDATPPSTTTALPSDSDLSHPAQTAAASTEPPDFLSVSMAIPGLHHLSSTSPNVAPSRPPEPEHAHPVQPAGDALRSRSCSLDDLPSEARAPSLMADAVTPAPPASPPQSRGDPAAYRPMYWRSCYMPYYAPPPPPPPPPPLVWYHAQHSYMGPFFPNDDPYYGPPLRERAYPPAAYEPGPPRLVSPPRLGHHARYSMHPLGRWPSGDVYPERYGIIDPRYEDPRYDPEAGPHAWHRGPWRGSY